jgi:SnoaL-like domain
MTVERAPVTATADETALRGIVEAYRRAFEERDLAGCVGFFADDAVIRFLFGSYQGRRAIEDWHKDRFAAEVQLLRIEGVSVEREKVGVQAVVTSRRLKQFLIGEVKGTVTFHVEDGRFKEAVLAPRKGVPSHLNWQFR